ncbi:HSP20-like chaperone [Hypomontagnella submonticulosa]|nr:HSP20-like chaperone [Hypomontagnella submonticulosa]
MQSSTRALKRATPHKFIKAKYTKPITITKTPINTLHTTTNKMSMFGPRFYTPAEPNFTGLFRLIDDFDKYALQNNGVQQQGARQGRHIPTFTPKFDLKETEDHYELHGELPGIEKDNVHIEFTDPQTVVVRGRVERTYTSGTPPAGLLEKNQDQARGAITEGPKDQQQQHHDKAHQPTVEDDTEEGGARSNANTTVAEVDKNKAAAEQAKQPQQPQHKFWVSERSVGEFSRTFQFPSRVDTDAVSASLNNGILSVVVPKAKKHEGRRIVIN